MIPLELKEKLKTNALAAYLYCKNGSSLFGFNLSEKDLFTEFDGKKLIEHILEKKQIDKSIVESIYENLEIILVDDGSPDNCGQICDDYAKKDTRIKVIHKKNGGLSDARNAGLEVCTGDYISFVDSDDWIELNAYEIMMKNMNEYNADIVVSNINYVYKDKVKSKYSEDKIRCFNKEESMKELIKDGLVQAVVWNKLYKREFIDNLRFKVGKLNEDEFFTYKICAKAERIVYTPEALYQYRQREDSIMGTYSLKRLDSVDAIYERLQFIKNKFQSIFQIISKKNSLENGIVIQITIRFSYRI